MRESTWLFKVVQRGEEEEQEEEEYHDHYHEEQQMARTNEKSLSFEQMNRILSE